MSLRPQTILPVPEETARVARAAFPHGNIFLLLRDQLGPFFADADFADLFSVRGQPAEAPWRLAMVTLFQFIEGLSDRAAADAVRSRLDWKYALSLELSDAGFDYSVLCEFRARLLDGCAERLLFDKLLNLCPRAQMAQSPWTPAHRLNSCNCSSARRQPLAVCY